MDSTAVSIARSKKDRIPFPAAERIPRSLAAVRGRVTRAVPAPEAPAAASLLPSVDEELLRDLRASAPRAAEALFERYHGRVYNLAMSILRNASDAEEAAQDVFLTVIRKADTFQGNSALYSWIYRICVNACLMRLRRRRRDGTVSIDDFMPVFTEEGLHASPVDDWSREVERRMLNKELGEVIRKYTDRLSEKYRVVFLLSDVEGLSNEETAAILGLSVPAVKSRLHRARLYLRQRLARYLKHGKA